MNKSITLQNFILITITIIFVMPSICFAQNPYYAQITKMSVGPDSVDKNDNTAYFYRLSIINFEGYNKISKNHVSEQSLWIEYLKKPFNWYDVEILEQNLILDSDDPFSSINPTVINIMGWSDYNRANLKMNNKCYELMLNPSLKFDKINLNEIKCKLIN